MKTIHYTNSIIFDSKEHCKVCKKGSLIVAERIKSLQCFHCGSGFADPLCWFCESGISGYLLAVGRVPSCLAGHESGWVKFCEDFTAGPSFGTDWKKDVGERRERAKDLFAKMRLESCAYCEHRNTDNIIKPVSQGDIIENKVEIDEILASGGIIELYRDPEATFCELDENAFGSKGVCSGFIPSKKSSFYHNQKTKLPRYIQALQFLELLYPPQQPTRHTLKGAAIND